MDLIICFIVTFLLLILSVYKGIFVAYPLIIGLILFFAAAVKRGYPVKAVLIMAYKGGKKSVLVIKIFVLIGAITAVWMASGTVSAIVYYEIKLLRPNIFILCAFLISSFVSLLIGTSFGTVGTVGIALIVIARSGGVNIAATSGAIIAGAYFGDRCSPMSSSASLVAYITETDIYDNIKNMFKSCIVPFFISVIFYAVISQIFPLHKSSSAINDEILKAFSVNIVVLLPALVIIIFSLFKVNVKVSMLISIITAFLLSVIVQHNTIVNSMKYIILGYSMDKTNPLYSIIKGGGVISMLKTSLVVFISSAFSGIFEETGMLNIIENITYKANSRYKLFRNMVITGILSSAFGCSQAIAVILTHMLNKKAYEKNKMNNEALAVDLENTAIIICALIPWNIALLLPIVNLGADASCTPYLFYLYILPIFNLLFLKFKSKQKYFFCKHYT
ncbi:sodium:proton antiporter [Clostridium carboxidivorans P7]|uniref:Na+/H+ antiporter NhaC n=1 Tax=Clostridium carboxidivorans P7 TaxID=536227 RepID=C6PV85_9CLOT|nr:Na+/H+ antiporter NhaC family protein [Clostridium carboxidivorans]AKN30739.1 sodium:proton antiporter [Clostridium carboxidivorans P7]EET86815.1 Na+/H+ antiporter NhaC [Clostridium carboxidivorans P7]EFG88559.1 putative Na+/H+ antiporter NhaC [Clostridium carboxidivorans P7]